MELRHLGSSAGDHRFQVVLKARSKILNIVGEYVRPFPFADLELQSRLFRALNQLPGSKHIQEFAANSNETTLSISVDDPGTPFGFALIQLEKFDSINESSSSSQSRQDGNLSIEEKARLYDQQNKRKRE